MASDKSRSKQNLILKARPEDLDMVTVGPQERVELQLVYWPSAVQKSQQTTIDLISRDAGTYTFQATGTGILHPQKEIHMPESMVRVIKGKMISTQVVFTNPMIEPIHLSVSLRMKKKAIRVVLPPEDNTNAVQVQQPFQLLLGSGARKSATILANSGSTQPMSHHKLTLQPFERLEVPFTFQSSSMEAVHAEIVLEASGSTSGIDGVRWVYPIIGASEMTVSNNVLTTVVASAAVGSTASLAETRPRREKPNGRNPALTIGRVAIPAAMLEARLGEVAHIQVDVPLPGLVSARKHLGFHIDRKAALAAQKRRLSKLSNSPESPRNETFLQETGIDFQFEFDENPGQGLKTSPSLGDGKLRHSLASLDNPAKLSEIASRHGLGEETLKIGFQHLVFPTPAERSRPGTQGLLMQTSSSSLPSPNPASVSSTCAVARFRVRFSPKEPLNVFAYLVVTDQLTKARWKVPLRIRSGSAY